jgi:DNA-binding NarL/FixJ family response regulator
VRVVIADDSVLMREGVARVLGDAGMEIVASVGDADGLRRAVATEKPDVAIVDVRMPPTQTDEGARAAETIRERHPDVGILMLSQIVEPHTACGCSASGLKDSATCSRIASSRSRILSRPCGASHAAGRRWTRRSCRSS